MTLFNKLSVFLTLLVGVVANVAADVVDVNIVDVYVVDVDIDDVVITDLF